MSSALPFPRSAVAGGSDMPLVPLSQVVDINPRRFDRMPTDDDLVSFVPMKDVEEETGRLDPSNTKHWRDVKRGFAPFQEGDVVFAKITPCMENGKFALARGLHDGRAAGSTELHVLRPNAGIDSKYLLYFLSRASLRSAARMQMKGAAGQLRVPPKFFDGVMIPVPPMDQQRQVVADLEEKLSDLDAGASALQRAQSNLKRYRASVLKAACEGQLLAPVPGRGFPSGWTLSTLGQLAKVGTGATPKRGKSVYWNRGAIPWITSAAVNSAVVTQADEFITARALAETNCKIYPPGTLLLAMYGEGRTRGKCSELTIAATTNQALAAIEAPTELRPYLKIALLAAYEETRKSASGGVQPNLNLNLVRSIPIALPPPEEQLRIVAEVERRLSVVTALEATVAFELHRAARLKQAILTKAFDGGNVPRRIG